MIPLVNCTTNQLEHGDVIQQSHTRLLVIRADVWQGGNTRTLRVIDLTTFESRECAWFLSVGDHDIIGGRKAQAVANGTAVVKEANGMRRVAHWVGYKETEVFKEAS
jgi:hypothetical protein